jgi:hypothetical protein
MTRGAVVIGRNRPWKTDIPDETNPVRHSLTYGDCQNEAGANLNLGRWEPALQGGHLKRNRFRQAWPDLR